MLACSRVTLNTRVFSAEGSPASSRSLFFFSALSSATSRCLRASPGKKLWCQAVIISAENFQGNRIADPKDLVLDVSRKQPPCGLVFALRSVKTQSKISPNTQSEYSKFLPFSCEARKASVASLTCLQLQTLHPFQHQPFALHTNRNKY